MFLDVVVLLAMVVFMDQLSSTMPPMMDGTPVLAQVTHIMSYLADPDLFLFCSVFYSGDLSGGT